MLFFCNISNLLVVYSSVELLKEMFIIIIIIIWWRYEDDPIIGHRLYREIKKVEVKKGKGKNIPPIPHSSYHWEAVATNLDEFMNISVSLPSCQYFISVQHIPFE